MKKKTLLKGNRYTYAELRELINGKVAILAEIHRDHSDLIDGVLVDVCTVEEEDGLAIKYMKEGRDYSFWYIGEPEILPRYF